MNAPGGEVKAHPYNEMSEQKRNKTHNKRRENKNNNKPLRMKKGRKNEVCIFLRLVKYYLSPFSTFRSTFQERETHLINVLNTTNTQKYKAVSTIEWQPHWKLEILFETYLCPPIKETLHELLLLWQRTVHVGHSLEVFFCRFMKAKMPRTNEGGCWSV